MALFSKLKTVVIGVAAALAATAAYASPKEEPFDPFTASIEVNVRTPEVPAKHKAAVAAAMENFRKTLNADGLHTDRVRDGEVVVVTIPCDKLFAPNASELKPDAAKQLLVLLPFIKRTDFYKVVVAVHSDDTGDSQYTDRITADRAAAVDGFFSREIGGAETGIIPYGIGADEPVAPNSGIKNRAANRRVEFYFIPTSTFISKAKK